MGQDNHLVFCITSWPMKRVPKNCKQFLTNGNNVAGNSKCSTDVFTEIALGRFAENQGLIIMVGQDNVTTEISKDSTNEVFELKSTKIILYCIAAGNNGENRIVVCSPDTDVLVLLYIINFY